MWAFRRGGGLFEGEGEEEGCFFKEEGGLFVSGVT